MPDVHNNPKKDPASSSFVTMSSLNDSSDDNDESLLFMEEIVAARVQNPVEKNATEEIIDGERLGKDSRENSGIVTRNPAYAAARNFAIGVVVGDYENDARNTTASFPGDAEERLESVIPPRPEPEECTTSKKENAGGVDKKRLDDLVQERQGNTQGFLFFSEPQTTLDMKKHDSRSSRPSHCNQTVDFTVERRNHQEGAANLIVDILIQQQGRFEYPGIMDQFLTVLLQTIRHETDWNVVSIIFGGAAATANIAARASIRKSQCRQEIQPHGHVVVQRKIQQKNNKLAEENETSLDSKATEFGKEKEDTIVFVDELRGLLKLRWNDFVGDRLTDSLLQDTPRRDDYTMAKSSLIQSVILPKHTTNGESKQRQSMPLLQEQVSEVAYYGPPADADGSGLSASISSTSAPNPKMSQVMFHGPPVVQDATFLNSPTSNKQQVNGSTTTRSAPMASADTIPPVTRPGAIAVRIPDDATLPTIIQPRRPPTSPIQQRRRRTGGRSRNSSIGALTSGLVASRFQSMSNWISSRFFFDAATNRLDISRNDDDGGSSTFHVQPGHSNTTNLESIRRSRFADNSDDLPIVASEVVEDDEERLEASIRKRVIEQSAQATQVISIEEGGHPNERLQREKYCKRQLGMLACVLLVVVIGFIIGFSNQRKNAVVPSPAPTTSPSPEPTAMNGNMSSFGPTTMSPITTTTRPTEAPLPTLSAIQERGYIRCCVKEGFQLGLLETELCRGLAVAILGNSSKIETSDCGSRGRWEYLADRSLDVVIRGSTHTTQRSIREPTTGIGFAFSSPYVYDGMVFGGISKMVECADRLDTYFGDCRRLVVCVVAQTTHEAFVTSRLPPQHIQVVQDFSHVLADGTCNVLVRDASVMAETLLQASDTTMLAQQDLSIGSNKFTKEPLAMATRSDDNEWTSFVEAFLQGLLEAQARNITQATAHRFPSVSQYVGLEYSTMIAKAVGSIGNFAEVYDRTLASGITRTGLNRLRYDDTCQDEGGLLYGIPFGSPIEQDPKEGNSKIATIVNQTKVRCGIPQQGSRNNAFHLEICKAISVALFGISDDNSFQLETVPFQVGSVDPFEFLLEGQVDVLVGIRSSDFPLLGNHLFSDLIFSKPYFFDSTGDDNGMTDSFVLATRAEHYQWSMFVHWVVNALIVAEEQLISKQGGNFRPGVDSPYDQMFRNVISTVGNYNEIYQRTIMVDTMGLEEARSGCNQLNTVPFGPQHFPNWFHNNL